MKQRFWEVWFISSVGVFLGLFMIGTLPGSVEVFPTFLWYFIPSIINLAVCLYIGTKKDDK
jgi:lipopolysaccharide export LptBFGC system permease protein LptF